MYRLRVRCQRGLSQCRIAVRTDCTDCIDAPLHQRRQQQALAAAQIKDALGLPASSRSQERQVSDREKAFDCVTADGFDPGLGFVLPALEQGGSGAWDVDAQQVGGLDAGYGKCR